jgi:hypothetical protein
MAVFLNSKLQVIGCSTTPAKNANPQIRLSVYFSLVFQQSQGYPSPTQGAAHSVALLDNQFGYVMTSLSDNVFWAITAKFPKDFYSLIFIHASKISSTNCATLVSSK